MVTMDMVNRLRESLEGEKDFEELSLEEKIDDIKRCHHEKELIQIKTILDKMKTYEDGNIKPDSKIEEIFQAFRAMSKELKTHFELEEIEVFPLLIPRHIKRMKCERSLWICRAITERQKSISIELMT